jgi:hypothetical protein
MCEQRPPVMRRLITAELRERERYLESQQLSARASERVRQWLMKHLSPEQLNDFSCTCAFNVRGGSTGTLYRITYGCSMNIIITDANGLANRRICFAPQGDLSTYDIMLAQKISLESDETATLRIANRTFLRVTNPRDQHGSPGQPWIAWASVDTLSQ